MAQRVVSQAQSTQRKRAVLRSLSIAGSVPQANRESLGLRLVGLPKRISRRLGDDPDLWRKGQKIESILPREIGDRDKLPLFPAQAVGEAWDIAHVDACANNAAALADRLERERHESANGSKDDRSIE